jgi:hypothetical protein
MGCVNQVQDICGHSWCTQRQRKPTDWPSKNKTAAIVLNVTEPLLDGGYTFEWTTISILPISLVFWKQILLIVLVPCVWTGKMPLLLSPQKLKKGETVGQHSSSFPFPFVPLQRRRRLVAPLFIWIVLVPCAGDYPSDSCGEWRGEYDWVSNWDRLELTPDLSTRWATGNDNFVYSSLWDFKSSFTCCKILRHGTFMLYFPSERKVSCGFLLPLKIHRLGQVLNPQPLGPVASTLTTTPPWRLGNIQLTW